MHYSPFYLFLFLGVLVTFSAVSEGLTCYKCSSKADDLCINDPTGISSGDVTVSCNSTAYCTTVRTEFTDIPGQVVSFVRDCEQNPLIKNEIRTDAHYTKFYNSCTKDKCNSDDGRNGIDAGSNGNLPSDIWYVPEKSTSNRFASSSLSLVLFTVLAVIYYSGENLY